MNYTREMQCCGLAELADIGGSTPKRILRNIAINMFNEQDNLKEDASLWDSGPDYSEAEYQCPFLIFSDVNKAVHGKALATYIRENKLGTVYGTKPRVNVRSGNMLRMWVWTVKKQALRKWLAENK